MILPRYDSFIKSRKNIEKLFLSFGIDLSKLNVINYPNKQLIKVICSASGSVTFFSGLIDKDELSILSRVPSDLILFNCSADYSRYLELGQELNFPTDNGYCFGYPQLIGVQPVSINDQKDIVFFEQVIVPATFSERCYLLRKLVDLANAFPDKKIWIKPRCKPGGRTIHKQIWHLETLRKLLRIKLPENLQFSYEPVEQLLARTSLCLTISSTVAIEALAREIPTVIISDFGVRRDIHTASFVGSGCLATIDQLIAGYHPESNSEWLSNYVQIPDVDAFKVRLTELLEKKKLRLLPQREYPEGAFSIAPDLMPTSLKKAKKFFTDPSGFCVDSKFQLINKLGKIVFSSKF